MSESRFTRIPTRMRHGWRNPPYEGPLTGPVVTKQAPPEDIRRWEEISTGKLEHAQRLLAEGHDIRYAAEIAGYPSTKGLKIAISRAAGKEPQTDSETGG